MKTNLFDGQCLHNHDMLSLIVCIHTTFKVTTLQIALAHVKRLSHGKFTLGRDHLSRQEAQLNGL